MKHYDNKVKWFTSKLLWAKNGICTQSFQTAQILSSEGVFSTFFWLVKYFSAESLPLKLLKSVFNAKIRIKSSPQYLLSAISTNVRWTLLLEHLLINICIHMNFYCNSFQSCTPNSEQISHFRWIHGFWCINTNTPQ